MGCHVAWVLRSVVPLQVGRRSDRENTRIEQLAGDQPDAGGLAEAYSHVKAVGKEVSRCLGGDEFER